MTWKSLLSWELGFRVLHHFVISFYHLQQQLESLVTERRWFRQSHFSQSARKWARLAWRTPVWWLLELPVWIWRKAPMRSWCEGGCWVCTGVKGGLPQSTCHKRSVCQRNSPFSTSVKEGICGVFSLVSYSLTAARGPFQYM